jgi:hypothetical protein
MRRSTHTLLLSDDESTEAMEHHAKSQKQARISTAVSM